MLDQNTDRMWYVIGAVIIGAAIILILNGTAPDLFASIGESFKEKTEEAISVIDSIDPMYGENLLSEYVIYDHNDLGATDKSQYDSKGIVYINADTQWSGMYIKLDDLDLKEDTTYLMRYSFQKTDGELLNIGGHTDYAFDRNRYVIDGQPVEWEYDFQNVEDEALMADDSAVHSVEVYFTTPSEFDPNKDLYDGRISIQPNRGSYVDVAVTVTDLELVEVLNE